ncbi:hypothetical protein MgSA37_03742 [Mucilaginibacter gotjawali]|uniref:Uncharacterized protein n=1 Tax=Mucilaginibacter gotjawali TaxID=1550579 RepID=A0A0X8X4I8_9SPHI|nr:hypothetical protein [Mucilaginibacter gotjawali]BAU55552.1 hypothetical protein MgSA37_03742 [Mucilaginibacter gotjawali]
MHKKLYLVLIWLIAGFNFSFAQVGYLGKKPGLAAIKNTNGTIVFENNVLALSFATNGRKLVITGFKDKQTNQLLSIPNSPLFSLLLGNNTVNSNEFTLVGQASLSEITGDKNALKFAGKLSGKKLSADLEDSKTGLKVHWEATLLNGANYLRQEFTFSVADSVKISKITLLKFPSSLSVKKKAPWMDPRWFITTCSSQLSTR